MTESVFHKSGPRQSVLEMRGVTKRFKERTVLDQLDFAVPRGSVTGLLGKNGAGKTTLLKCALGLQTPQAGTITVFGEDSRVLSGAAKARLAYVPQEVSLYPWMKIRQVVAYTAAFYPLWNSRLIERLIKEWEINPEDKVGPLSTGQRQKLGILLALGHEPELLILDEPVASLDPTARRQFLATLLDISLNGERTILFSTHITSDLERVADRVAILKEGLIVYDDELAQLKDSVKRLRISVRNGLPDDLRSLPGMLHCEANGKTAVFSLRGFQLDLPERLAREWSAEVSVEDLNLEEIFLELHHE
ncbi:MAG: ABC transporter ATP-binding protein [Planctomycetia bacterium]|nr:ABC transporter ATP-binding protein [Planctomycetia bacterium]